MKVLIVGLGSIGQRHLRNVKSVFRSKPLSLMACRKTESKRVIENGKTCKVDSLSDYYGFNEYQDLENALAGKPDATFICLPSSLHLKTAIQAVRADSHLFIEKPLATDTSGLDELEHLVYEKKRIVMVHFTTTSIRKLPDD